MVKTMGDLLHVVNSARHLSTRRLVSRSNAREAVFNRRLSAYVCEKATWILDNVGQSMRGAKILVLGVAARKNTSDCRHSVALATIDRLKRVGVKVSYCDPYVPRLDTITDAGRPLSSVALIESRLAGCDLVVIAMDHDTFNFDWIAAHAPRILDIRQRSHWIHAATAQVWSL